MVLTGPTSSNVDFSPQGLLEKVFTPLVVHSQICPGCTSGATAVCACVDRGAESGCVAGEVACATAAIGCTGAGAVGARAGGVGSGAAGCAARTCGAKVGASRWVDTAAKATAIAAADRPPRIQGSKSRSLFMSRLSSAAQQERMKMRID